MPSKYKGVVEVDPNGTQNDGQVLVWDAATGLHKYIDAPSGGINSYIASAPGSAGLPITNLYFDPATGKIVGEYDDAGLGSANIASNPPQGKHPITNLYFDPVSGRITGEYDDGA